MAIEASEIGAGLGPAEAERPTAKASALLASVGGGQIAVWAALVALAPAQAVIYRWRWRLAMREYRTESIAVVPANRP